MLFRYLDVLVALQSYSRVVCALQFNILSKKRPNSYLSKMALLTKSSS